MITPKERVLKALFFNETDFVPYHIQLSDDITAKIRPFIEEDLFSQFTNHLPFINIEPKQYWRNSDCYSDDFGSVWKVLNQVPHLVDFPLKNPTLKNYSLPENVVQAYDKKIELFLSHHSNHFVLCGLAQGFFDRGWALRGNENFMMDLIENPLFVEKFFEMLTDFYIRQIDEISKYAFDGIRFGDDWGAQRGLLMGPKRWRRFIKPGLKRIFERAQKHSLVVMVHSDGDIFDIIPDLIEIGVQILNPIQPEAMNIYKIKKLYGKNLCLNGGISSQYTLPWGTSSEVQQEVIACLQYLARGGGYVIGPAKSILPETPLENILALFESILNQPKTAHSIIEPFPDSVPEIERVYQAFHP